MKTTQIDNDLLQLLNTSVNSGGPTEETVDGDQAIKWLTEHHNWSYYGHGDPNYCESAIRLKDGSILLVFSLNSFAGTFQSYDDIRVEWWHLVPDRTKWVTERQMFTTGAERKDSEKDTGNS